MQGGKKTLVADARAAIELCAGTNSRLIARRITRFLEARMQASELSIAQFGLLTHVAAADDDTIGALAERMDLDQSTLSRNLRALERLGLVEIAIVEKDLRRRAVWLTEQGARRLEAAIPIWGAAQQALSDVIDPAELRGLAIRAEALSRPAGEGAADARA